ncbi:MAG: hypothetical protein MJE66_24905 [Proteobacteria bacterium]|nr:hypothetical protein [Pseudomonadota bacterium]
MNYDPFERGPHPVGVRSTVATDPARARELPIEAWYPADARHAGDDLRADTQDRDRVEETHEMFRLLAGGLSSGLPGGAGLGDLAPASSSS